jgi:hypothetical protein
MTRFNINLAADLDTGEGELTALNRDKVLDLLNNPLLAMDVLQDWVGELRYYYAIATAGFRGEGHRVCLNAGHVAQPTLDHILSIYEDTGVSIEDLALVEEFDLRGGWNMTPVLEAHVRSLAPKNHLSLV